MDHNKDKLIAKFLTGNASEKEITILKNWLAQNPSHQTEFDKAKKVWESAYNLKIEKQADVDAAWANFRSLAENQPKIKATKPVYRWLAAAASVVLLIVSGAILKNYLSDTNDVSPAQLSNISTAVQPESVAVFNEVLEIDTIKEAPKLKKIQAVKVFKKEWQKNPGMITLITGDSAKAFLLPDNSVVLLNANSKIEYLANFSVSNRRVSLVGEAYFEVKRDSGQFVIACENTIIRGKDASFNLKSFTSDKEVEVIVAAGEVEFSGIGSKEFKKLTLTKGQSGIYKKETDVFVKSESQRKNYKWWKKSLRASIRSFFDRLFGRKSK